MAFNYTTFGKNGVAAGIVTLLNSGSLEVLTAGYATLLVSFPFNSTSGTISGGVITFSGFPKVATSVGDGTAALARIKDSSGNIIVDSLTVSVTGGDVNFNSTTFLSGASITIDGLALTVN